MKKKYEKNDIKPLNSLKNTEKYILNHEWTRTKNRCEKKL